MAIAVKTQAQYLAEIEALILGADGTIDTRVGVIPTVFMNPLSVIAAEMNTSLINLSTILSLANWAQMTDSELEAFASNYFVVRNPGGVGSGYVFFQTKTRPVMDITIYAGYPVGTTANSQGQSVIFMVTTTTVMSAVSIDTYYNAVDQVYEIQVPVKALQAGSAASVPAGAINTMLRNLVGIDTVTNKTAISLVADQETNAELAQSVQLTQAGVEIDVPSGLKYSILSQPSITDVDLVYKKNPLLIRENTDVGAVDAYILDTQPQQVVEVFRFSGDYILRQQPALTLVSVVDVSSVDRTANFTFTKDTGIYEDSIRASDKIVYGSGIDNLIGTLFTVTYTIEEVVGTLQTAYEQDDSDVLGRDLLFRKAYELDMVINGTATIQAGFDSIATKALIAAAISSYVNALKLGAAAEAAEAIYVSLAIAGVSNLVFSDFRLTTETAGTVHDVDAGGNQFIRVTAANVNIS